MKTPVITNKIHPVYENSYVNVFDNYVTFPSGVQGRYFKTKWKAPFGVGIVVVCNDSILLLNKYNYQEQTFSYEIPQGFGQHGETPILSAIRELKEETGISVTKDAIKPLYKCGFDFSIYIYCIKVQSENVSLNANEDTETICGFKWAKIDKNKFKDLIGLEIIDQLSISSIMFYFLYNV